MNHTQNEHHLESERKLKEELRKWKEDSSMPEVLMNEGDDKEEYDRHRVVFNTRFHRWPLAIILCANEDHVVATVNLANKYNWPLRVRSGGHDHEAFCTADNALAIDLRKMHQVVQDKDDKLKLRVGPGIPFKDLIVILNKLKVCIPHGTCGTVNVAGFTLGGGWGPWTRIQGMCVEHLIGAKLVLKTGEKIEVTNTCTDQRGKDILWALRGGGGVSCGIVTEFIFKAFVMPEDTIKFNLVWQGKPALKVLEMWEKIIEPGINRSLIGTNLMIAAVNPKDVTPDISKAEHECTFFGYFKGTYGELTKALDEWFIELPPTQTNIPIGPLPGRVPNENLLAAAGPDAPDLIKDNVEDNWFDEKLIAEIEQRNEAGRGLLRAGGNWHEHNIILAPDDFSIFRTWDMPVQLTTVTTAGGRKLGAIPPDKDDPGPHKITSKVMKWFGPSHASANDEGGENRIFNERERARINVIRSLQSEPIPRKSTQAGEHGYNACNVQCYATLGSITGPYYSEHKNYPDEIGCALPYRHNFYTVQYQAWWNNNCIPEAEWPIAWIAICRDFHFPETEGSFISFRDKEVPYSTYFLQNYPRLKEIMEKYSI